MYLCLLPPCPRLDLTPPQMMVVDAEAIAKDTLRILLQVDEGSKVWCAAWTSEPGPQRLSMRNLDLGSEE